MERVICPGHRALQDLGLDAPHIAVCAINPHAGEGGLFGHSEEEKIAPAVRVAVADGLDAVGPLPAPRSTPPRVGTSTSWSRFTTTRGTGRSRSWASTAV